MYHTIGKKSIKKAKNLAFLADTGKIRNKNSGFTSLSAKNRSILLRKLFLKNDLIKTILCVILITPNKNEYIFRREIFFIG